MKFKDKGEEKTKEGCGRVMALKVAQTIRSYTIQSTMIPSFYHKYQKNNLKEIKNSNFKYFPYNKDFSYGIQNEDDNKAENPLIEINKQLGRSICISVLDMLEKNPFSRLI